MEYQQNIQAQTDYTRLENSLAAMTADEAFSAINTFMQRYPDYPQAHNDLAVLLYQRGDLLAALGRFERAVRLDPRNRTFRKNLASFYFVELGWTDDAIMMYSELLKEVSEDVEVLEALALISCKIDRPAEAGHFLRKILDLEPWNTEARTALDSLSIPAAVPRVIPVTAPVAASGEVDALLADLRQSVAELSRPTVQQEASHSNAALQSRITELENVLRNDPTNALVNNDLGVLYLEAGNLERSTDHHELAFRYAPQNLTFRKNLAGVCAVSDGGLDRAIELLTGGLRNYPADVEILSALVQVCIRLGRKEEALIFLKRILDLEPWNQDARALLAQIQDAASDSFFLNR